MMRRMEDENEVGEVDEEVEDEEKKVKEGDEDEVEEEEETREGGAGRGGTCRSAFDRGSRGAKVSSKRRIGGQASLRRRTERIISILII